jgi:xanthine/CO dehydrogenase XdhC/CoxF family maturation factor
MRTELPQLIDLARRLLDAGEPGTLATLFSANGSSYRSLGSMMIGGPPGTLAGGVSGGCLEEYITRHARELTRNHSAVLLSFDTGSGDSDDPKPILGCGASIDILIERLTPDHLAHLQQFTAAYDADSPALTTCTITPTQTPLTVTRRWGRSAMDDPTADLARQALCDRRSYCAQTSPHHRTLVHYIPPLTRIVILGAGDDVRPLSDLAHSLGWHITIADRRARHATHQRFPSADAVIAATWESALNQIRFTPNTAIVLMTHSLPDDALLLPLLADKPCAYIGVLGPPHRREALLHFAAQNQPLDDQFIDRLRGPIGLDLGDRSAPGIALSVISEIAAHLNERTAKPMCQLLSPTNYVFGPTNA